MSVKVKLAPVIFPEINERERGELASQMEVLLDLYGEYAEFLPFVTAGDPLPPCDAVLLPQLIGAAFGYKDVFKGYEKPFVVLTSKFGTVEMWDWEIVTFLRGEKLTVFAPYDIELARTVLCALGVRASLPNSKFLMFQDSPGEGMQANIFKKFYWWEDECTRTMEDLFGIQMIYKSWKEVSANAKAVPDDAAKALLDGWQPHQEGVCEKSMLSAAKIYIAVKAVIDELGRVDGVGSNCLNESFYCDSTPCLAWNMLFEKDDIIWACEGDTLTLLSTFILYRSLRKPIMMTNLYPFLVGMAALAHEKIDRFPDIQDPDDHALGVHCGYFGFAPRKFCSKWTVRPKVLEIVDENAIVVDCEFPVGPVTLAKIYPDFKRLSVIQAEIEEYVQYPGSDCRNGALIRYRNGHKVMENLCSHHSLIISGNVAHELLQVAKVFGWETIEL